jgi:hypothetical protein
MEIIIYIFAASFVFMGVALFMVYRKTRHYGVFLMGTTYFVAALIAVLLKHWWPLIAGFVLVWVLKLMGLDPGTNRKQGPPGGQP